ncbi:hypothetical protein DPMN_004712 [Dreissena polymorpha]|uniref:Uncharacterized protein n=1 Tax=Dreissena polymorpha TaxID=45954 RepID=A0A9D4MNZ6_DREPO|nr:hypothetical protein DPMN_004712 [Dreissena polymorpha]
MLWTKFRTDRQMDGQTGPITISPQKKNSAGIIRNKRAKMALVRSPERSRFIQSLPNVKLDLDIVQTFSLYTYREKCPAYWRPYINKANVLTNFHINQLTGTIFELNSHIKETNVLTKFHENWAKNVTSRVFTCFHYIPGIIFFSVLSVLDQLGSGKTN